MNISEREDKAANLYADYSTYIEFFRANCRSQRNTKIFLVVTSVLTMAVAVAPLIIPATVVVITGTLGLALSVASGLGILIIFCSIVALAILAYRKRSVDKSLEKLHDSRLKRIRITDPLYYKSLRRLNSYNEIGHSFFQAILDKDLLAVQICLIKMPKKYLSELWSKEIILKIMSDETKFNFVNIRGEKIVSHQDRHEATGHFRIGILREMVASGWCLSPEMFQDLLEGAVVAACYPSVHFLITLAGKENVANFLESLERSRDLASHILSSVSKNEKSQSSVMMKVNARKDYKYNEDDKHMEAILKEIYIRLESACKLLKSPNDYSAKN